MARQKASRSRSSRATIPQRPIGVASSRSSAAPARPARQYTGLAGWINERIDIDGFYRNYGRKAFPVHTSFFLGEMALFSFVILVARLRALIRRGAPERPAQIAVGSLVLDPARRSVQRDGVVIPLTAREYGLLLYLMRNAGDVVSKSQILENVWDSAYSGGDNVIEVYVSYLRKKIDLPFGLQTLQTLRGLGYRLDSDRPRVPAERANRDGHGVARADPDANASLDQPAVAGRDAVAADVSPGP